MKDESQAAKQRRLTKAATSATDGVRTLLDSGEMGAADRAILETAQAVLSGVRMATMQKEALWSGRELTDHTTPHTAAFTPRKARPFMGAINAAHKPTGSTRKQETR